MDTVRASILDRLLDDFPEEQDAGDPGVVRAERRLCDWDACCSALKRDVEMLLSSRPLLVPSAGKTLVEKSVAAYGLPRTSSNPEADIIDAIKTFEPRLKNVTPLQNGSTPEDMECSFTAKFTWAGTVKELVLNISVENDGYVVEIYE